MMTDTLERTRTDQSDHQTLDIEVGGMTCASCVRRVEKSLTKVPGVAEANVNLATHRATVHFDPTQASVAQLTGAIDRAGYSPGTIIDPYAPAPAPHADHATMDHADHAIGSAGEHDHLSHGGDEMKRKALVSLAIGLVMMLTMYVETGIST